MYTRSFLGVIICLATIFIADGSPRLLVGLDGNCHFVAEELLTKFEMHNVAGSSDSIKQEIRKIDHNSEIHVIHFNGQIDNLEIFCREIGYDFILLTGDLDTAVQSLQERLDTIPKTDADLPHIDPATTGMFYSLMMKVDRIFRNVGLPYWATCGTLLGAVRHGGMIPWDDDLDIAILAEHVVLLESVKNALADEGLQLYYYAEGGFYKIFFSNGLPILRKDGTMYPWTYPFLDLFPYEERNEKVEYVSNLFRRAFPDEYFASFELIFPLYALPFGPMQILVPANYYEIIERMYGPDWDKVAYIKYDHKNERRVKKIKVDLVDRSAPAYVLPANFNC